MNPLDRKIWWLASYPKSGNTWVRMFLNAYVTGFPIDINSAFQYVMGDIYPEGLQMICPRDIKTLTTKEQYMYHNAMLLNLLNMNPTKDVCLKTHNAKCRVEEIPTIPPSFSAGAVYIIRDPRDVVISLSHHFNIDIDASIAFMNNIKQAGEHVNTKLVHILLTWSLHVTTWTNKNEDVPTTVIKYEDLLENTEETFVKILKALSFNKINKEKLKFALEETKFEKLRAFEDKFGFREKANGDKFFRVGKAGQWKTKLTKKQIKQIEEDHKDVMEKFGYLNGGN